MRVIPGLQVNGFSEYVGVRGWGFFYALRSIQ
jgi:hypothetical protein